MAKLKFVGKSFPRLDAQDKVTGQAVYSTDVRLPGILYGRILRSPYPHARIVHIDTARAEKLVGVKAVVTAQDTPKLKFGPLIEDWYPLAVDKVRFVGDELAAVAATDEELAREALELIEVEYEPLPPVFDVEEALKPDAPLIHEELAASGPSLEMEQQVATKGKSEQVRGNVCAWLQIERGDLKKGFEEAAFIFHDKFMSPSVHQCYLEPMACVASVDMSGKVTLWTASINQFGLRSALARILAMNESKLRIIQTCVGGSFGGKQLPQTVYSAAVLLAKKSGRPVRLENSREEEFTASLPRLPMMIEIKLGAKADGILSAKQVKITADAGAYAALSPRIMTTAARRVDNLYRLSNIQTEAMLVYTNKTPFGAFRGFGNPQMTFALESAMDMLAKGLNLDPMELRLRNATRSGDVTAHGWLINSCGLSECINRSARLSAFRKRRQPGFGMACLIHVSDRRQTAGFGGSTAWVKINEDGNVFIISSEAELGQGIQNVLAQIVAEELGVPPQGMQVSVPDTDFTPYCLGPFGDRVTLSAGNAARLAAQDAKRQLVELAAARLEANANDLELAEGRLFVRGVPGRGITIADAAREAIYRRGGSAILGKGVFEPETVAPDPKTFYGNLSSAYVFGAQAVEVEVERDTGRVRLLNFYAAHDLGKTVNPMAAVGQIEGALAQGIGFALSEQLAWKQGGTFNPNFLDYRIPTALDMPGIKTVLVESNAPTGPYGAKGVAEPGLVPVAPAIANAIYWATGVRIKSLPITPDKVLQALERQEFGGNPL